MPAKNKRKSNGQLSKAKKSRNSADDDIYCDKNIFVDLLTTNGFKIMSGGAANQIEKDQAIFQRTLAISVKRHPDYPQVVEEFIEAAYSYIEDRKRFFWSLMPTQTANSADESTRGGNQDSLIRLLLQCDYIQTPLMTMLLEKMAEFTGDEEPIVVHNEKINLPKLIMNQFRWLDRIHNSQDVTQKMLEISCIVSKETQHEIITCLPEIVEDAQHNIVAKELKDMFIQDNSLVVPILDALSNLNLKSELICEVRRSLVEQLASVDLSDLPVIMKFLLQTVTPNDAFQVVCDVRKNLDFQSSFPPTSCSTPYSRAGSHRPQLDLSTERGCEALTLDAIRAGIRFHKSVAEAWIKAIEAGASSSDHGVLDIFALLLMHSNGYKKPIESLIRNKIRAGHFTDMLIKASLHGHAQILRDYFGSVLSLGEVLLRSPEPAIEHFASCLYIEAFLAFDMYCQQEIVGSLVTHIGSGFEGEIDTSLSVLCHLVKTNVAKMSPFTVFIKGVLDYLDNLSVKQIRKLYETLSILAFQNPAENGMIQDELHIIIRKQLSNNETKYKKMGVIGAVMVIHSLAEPSINQTLNATTEQVSMTDETYKQVTGLLQLIKSSSSTYPRIAALYMDELSSVLQKGNIDARVEGWISDNVINDFQDDYVIDIEGSQTENSGLLSLTLQYNLDEAQSQGAIAINLFPLLTKDKKDNLPSLTCLAPQFRLLQISIKRQNEGVLDDIDALLGCPVFLAEPEIYDKTSCLSVKELHFLCDSLFICINWFRELVNAFASIDEAEMKAKVMSRLQHITTLQRYLKIVLAECPSYTPLMANFDVDEAKNPLAPNTLKRPNKKAKKAKTVAGNSDEETASTTVIEPDLHDNNVEEKAAIDLQRYALCFRELDLDVFNILQSGLITKSALDSNLNTEATTTVQLQAEQLEFLLEDLATKLEHALPATVAKRRTFLKTKSPPCSFALLDSLSQNQIVIRTVQLLPALCDHMDRTHAFFQTQIKENDGIIDGPGCASEETKLLSHCFLLQVKSLLALISWSGFQMTENQTLLKEILAILATRVKESLSTESTTEELVRHAFLYVESFAKTVPHLLTGVVLLNLLAVIDAKAQVHELHDRIGEMSITFLQREWRDSTGEKEKGSKHNELLQQLFELMFKHSNNKLKCVEDIATVGMTEYINSDKQATSETYPTLTKNSNTVFYRQLLAQVVNSCKSLPCLKQSDSDQAKLNGLIEWGIVVRLFHILVNLIKVFDSRTNVGSLLKHGRLFLETFVRNCMPLLDQMFKTQRDDVQSLLKTLQTSTRILHHLCGHSKIMRDVALTKLVPLMKKCLESFVYRVKAMLTVNKCTQAFWLGNLKNRDLQGEEILSQSSMVENDQSNDSENECIPENNSESEVELDDDDDGEEQVLSNENESCSQEY